MKSVQLFKRVRPTLCLAGLLLAVGLVTGCEMDSANESPVGPDVSGDWSGTFTFPGRAPMAITAKITQNGNALFMETSLPADGRLFSGYLTARGDLFMTDAYDRETWTNPGAPVTPNRVVLLDYAFGPNSALQRIELTR